MLRLRAGRLRIPQAQVEFADIGDIFRHRAYNEKGLGLAIDREMQFLHGDKASGRDLQELFRTVILHQLALQLGAEQFGPQAVHLRLLRLEPIVQSGHRGRLLCALLRRLGRLLAGLIRMRMMQQSEHAGQGDGSGIDNAGDRLEGVAGEERQRQREVALAGQHLGAQLLIDRHLLIERFDTIAQFTLRLLILEPGETFGILRENQLHRCASNIAFDHVLRRRQPRFIQRGWLFLPGLIGLFQGGDHRQCRQPVIALFNFVLVFLQAFNQFRRGIEPVPNKFDDGGAAWHVNLNEYGEADVVLLQLRLVEFHADDLQIVFEIPRIAFLEQGIYHVRFAYGICFTCAAQMNLIAGFPPGDCLGLFRRHHGRQGGFFQHRGEIFAQGGGVHRFGQPAFFQDR